MRFRFFVLPLFLSVPLLSYFGCGDSGDKNKTGPAKKPFAGQTVVIAIPAGYGFAQHWELILREWKEQTGAEFQFQEYDAQDRKSSLAEQFGLGETPSETLPATLFVFPTNRFSELIESKIVAEIPPEEQSPARLNWLDLFAGLRKHVVSMGRRKWGAVPLSAPVLVCYYRKDLLEKADRSPPKTWEDYQKLIDALDRWAPGMTAVEPWGEEFRTTMFLSRAASYAKHPENYSFFFDITTGKPLINTEGFVRALEESDRAIKQMPQQVKSYSPADCRRDLISGKAAMAISYETTLISDDETATSIKRPEGLQVGFFRLPGVVTPYNRSNDRWQKSADGRINTVSVTGFSGLSVAVSSGCTPRQAQAAWNLLKRLLVDEISTAFPPGTKSVCRESQFETASSWLGDDLFPDETYGYLNVVAESLRDKQLVCELPVIGRERFRTALSEGLRKVLDGEAQPRRSLDAVAEQWQQIVNQIGTKKITNSYRGRLGLVGK